ncbi:hypothetical protein [Hymenobacter chitinivorans]|uniref:Lipoprotein n=1 Tax=Hymenobacter chitinivorans DSM 11115 TaxID=1121954 RepID=A0A2M9AQZ3_9BACT|nr:hypothetical protein [Hymenobacter chitinivorans]PJJ48124.1 hypothetical protein CLV45_4817 [Hymenobacter chitinivorans DSM 11115]
MKLTQRFVLAAVLGAAASLTTACDRAGTPGDDRQNVNDFSTAPPARTIETNMDSVNGQQNAPEPGGVGSAADQAQSTDNALNSAPGGNSSTSPQAASGTPNTVDKVTSNNSQNGSKAPSQNSTAPSTAAGSTQNTGTADKNGSSGRVQ